MNDLIWVELSRDALRHNVSALRHLVGEGVKVAPCVKANAYGHGLLPVAQLLVEDGVEWLAVQHAEDALVLRQSGVQVPILVMGPVADQHIRPLVEKQVRVFIDQGNIQKFQDAAALVGSTFLVHLEVDTGMSRFGVFPSELPEFLDIIASCPNLKLEAVATHFASAGGPYLNQHMQDQLDKLAEAKRIVSERGLDIFWHTAKSSAAVQYPDTRCEMIRPGIVLYGYAGGGETANALARENIQLEPVLSLKTRVGSLKRVTNGTPVSYDATFIADHDTLLAVIPIGYADGLNRQLSNHGQVLIRGKKLPIRGRVCMNVIMVEVPEDLGVEVGDEVVLIGRQGDEMITADHIAQLTQTIPYEVLTSIRESIPRYVV